MTDSSREDRIDRLYDAIDLLNAGERQPALALLRDLIREDNDFEEAWMWMSVAVDSLDQSAVCLDNVLRINPNNSVAAAALHRIRQPEMLFEQRRTRLRFYRDMTLASMWILVVALLYTMLFAYVA